MPCAAPTRPHRSGRARSQIVWRGRNENWRRNGSRRNRSLQKLDCFLDPTEIREQQIAESDLRLRSLPERVRAARRYSASAPLRIQIDADRGLDQGPNEPSARFGSRSRRASPRRAPCDWPRLLPYAVISALVTPTFSFVDKLSRRPAHNAGRAADRRPRSNRSPCANRPLYSVAHDKNFPASRRCRPRHSGWRAWPRFLSARPARCPSSVTLSPPATDCRRSPIAPRRCPSDPGRRFPTRHWRRRPL